MISRINIEKSNKMPAVITDQFRILNASNFVDTVTGIGGSDPVNSFYVTLGLPNAEAVGFGRTSNFNDVSPCTDR